MVSGNCGIGRMRRGRWEEGMDEEERMVWSRLAQ